MKRLIGVVAVLAVLTGGACSKSTPSAAKPSAPSLEGGWRAHVTFASGPLKGVPFQFLITYAAGGGMVESSNFDEVPPVPPAYGSWARTGPQNFKSTYVFFATKTANAKDVTKGWTFSGVGVLNENIAQGKTGDAYSSSISYQLFDAEDKPLTGQSGTGSVTASRIIIG
jgi:hypothetical protein